MRTPVLRLRPHALGMDNRPGTRTWPFVDLVDPLQPGFLIRLIGWDHYATVVPDGALWRMTRHWPDGSHEVAGRWPMRAAIRRARLWLRAQAMYSMWGC